MRAFFFLIIVIVIGAYVYPAWHERTASACDALEKRAGELANAEMRGPSAFGGGGTLGAAMRNASGGLATTTLNLAIPDLPPSIGCTISYWRLVLNPNLGAMLAAPG